MSSDIPSVRIGQHWSTAQVAEHFNVARGDVAYWCRAGIINTLPRWSDAARWKIPVVEVARLEKEGLPPSPRTIRRMSNAR